MLTLDHFTESVAKPNKIGLLEQMHPKFWTFLDVQKIKETGRIYMPEMV
jgi:hypothetical protein